MGANDPNTRGNDCWGWTDPVSGREFALFGLTDATAFVEITDPENPVYVGRLPGAGSGNEAWRDMKVYNNRAYIVADGSGNSSHGVQVFELNRLLNVTSPPVIFTDDVRYTALGRAHNIIINEDSGYAYVVGSPSQASSGGPIILDLKVGVMPGWRGTLSADGYTHDGQVVIYHGPDRFAVANWIGIVRSYIGREIAFCCNEDTLTIADVTQKGKPRIISRTTYPQSRYSHQGWLTDDHKFFFMDDELDEQQLGPFPTRTHVWDVRDLDNPVYLGFVEGTAETIDHNLYVKGNYIYETNYTSGLRVLRIDDPLHLNMPVVGFFDTYYQNDGVTFNGSWSSYPFYPSGNIVVSDRQNGLFVLRFTPPSGRSQQAQR